MRLPAGLLFWWQLAGLAIGVHGFFSSVGQGRVTLVDLPWVPVDGDPLSACGRRPSAGAGAPYAWPRWRACSSVEYRTPHQRFFAFFLALIGGVYGVFLSYDLFSVALCL